MPVLIVPFYAALLALFYIFLSIRVVRIRVRDRIALGDANNARLRRTIRVHGNFAEYVPLAVLLAGFVELQQASPLMVHLIALALIAGRLIHAYGVSQENEDHRLRVAGMVLTFASIAGSAVILIGSFLRAL